MWTIDALQFFRYRSQLLLIVSQPRGSLWYILLFVLRFFFSSFRLPLLFSLFFRLSFSFALSLSTLSWFWFRCVICVWFLWNMTCFLFSIFRSLPSLSWLPQKKWALCFSWNIPLILFCGCVGIIVTNWQNYQITFHTERNEFIETTESVALESSKKLLNCSNSPKRVANLKICGFICTKSAYKKRWLFCFVFPLCVSHIVPRTLSFTMCHTSHFPSLTHEMEIVIDSKSPGYSQRTLYPNQS